MKKLILFYITIVIAVYWIWVYFSYLIIPFKPAEYNIAIKRWACDGYFKAQPGKYHNSKYNTRYTINSKGFRGDEFSEKEGLRIIAIGASSTMGVESNDPDTWPAKLQKYLGIETLNCGIGSATSGNHLKMMDEVLEYEPDIIVYYAGRNDHGTDNFERYPGPELFPDGRWIFFKRWAIYKKIQLRFILLKFLNFDIDPLIPINQWTRSYRANLENMIQKASEAGASFVIVTQVLDYPDEIYEAIINEEDVVKKISFKDRRWHLFLRQMDVIKIQRQLSEGHGLTMIDLHEEFYNGKKGKERLFYDYIHLAPEGNDLIARTVTRHLKAKNERKEAL